MKNNIDTEIIRSFDERMDAIYEEKNNLYEAGLFAPDKDAELEAQKDALDKEFKKLLFNSSVFVNTPNGRIIFDDLYSKAVDEAAALYDGEFQDIHDCFVFFEAMVEKALVLTGTIQ